MKVTYDLPEELVRELKVRAAQQGRTVKDVVAEALHGALYGEEIAVEPVEPVEPRSCRILHDERGIPYFETSADAAIPAMTLEESLALEEQADEEEALQRAGLSR